MRKVVLLLVVLVCSAAAFGQRTTEGSLYAVGKSGKEIGACPLKSTAVKADISGFISRVRVKQEFQNTFTEPIEAVYVFPLSQNGAVDEMTMTVGSRVIRGKIMRREEARQIYEAAKTQGKAASLLDQERPNIFTQSVANIMPGEKIVIEISYVETLKYEEGSYEFVFPMTVGPRYIPGSVPDAAKISPPVATRTGSDISIEVNVNAGIPIEEVRSGSSHELTEVKMTPSVSKVTLRNEKTIPNKDFILRYDVTGKRIEDGVLVHRDPRGGFFTMILQPPDKIANEDRTPKEIVFVLDTSGSMGGFPIEKAKEAMKLSLEGLYPDDTFNLITFAGDTHVLFEKPVPATRANLDAAQAFLDSRRGGGGTEMMKAIKAALEPTESQEHLRIVCFMTDGFVGNESQIIAEVQKYSKARVFSFGIGNSVNRFLLDKLAAEGKGEVEYVGLKDDGSKAAKRFYERVRTPLLTDLSIEWNGLPVADVYPGKLTDLFSAKPVVLYGRYTEAGRGSIKLKGNIAGQPYERNISVDLPAAEPANSSLATLWARTRIDELSMQRLSSKSAEAATAMDKQIADLALEFGLMSSFTSFVAVEDRVINVGGTPTTQRVPVAAPEGGNPATASQHKTWSSGDVAYLISGRAVQTESKSMASASGSGSGSGGGLGSGNGNASGSGSSPVFTSAMSAAVNVTADQASVDTSETRIQTTVTAKTIQSLPIQTRQVNGLLMTPGFALDGSSGTETFVIDGTEVTRVRPAPANSANAQPLGRVMAIVEPELPASDRGLQGVVEVEVQIEKTGKVVAAQAVSGSEPLRRASLRAAGLSRFYPANVGGIPVRLRGTIVYKFGAAEKAEISLKRMKAIRPTAADLRLHAAGGKLHHWLFAIVDRLATPGERPAAHEASFVRDGKALVRISLSAFTPTLNERLNRIGFEINAMDSTTSYTGAIPLYRLLDLAEITEVKLVVPLI